MLFIEIYSFFVFATSNTKAQDICLFFPNHLKIPLCLETLHGRRHSYVSGVKHNTTARKLTNGLVTTPCSNSSSEQAAGAFSASDFSLFKTQLMKTLSKAAEYECFSHTVFPQLFKFQPGGREARMLCTQHRELRSEACCLVTAFYCSCWVLFYPLKPLGKQVASKLLCASPISGSQSDN